MFERQLNDTRQQEESEHLLAPVRIYDHPVVEDHPGVPYESNDNHSCDESDEYGEYESEGEGTVVDDMRNTMQDIHSDIPSRRLNKRKFTDEHNNDIHEFKKRKHTVTTLQLLFKSLSEKNTELLQEKSMLSGTNKDLKYQVALLEARLFNMYALLKTVAKESRV